jgi:serine O-acetyltransferase
VLKTFAADVRAKAEWTYEGIGTRAILKALLADGTPAMFWYRLMQWSRRWRIVPLELACSKILTWFCGCIIGRGAEFGPRFVLIHSNGVVVNGGVNGGSDVRIEHQVTIGAERRKFPTLGNRVFIGAGAKIVGGVVVGDDVMIGANAVVVKDVPSNSTAVGVPARCIPRKSASQQDCALVVSGGQVLEA